MNFAADDLCANIRFSPRKCNVSNEIINLRQRTRFSEAVRYRKWKKFDARYSLAILMEWYGKISRSSLLNYSSSESRRSIQSGVFDQRYRGSTVPVCPIEPEDRRLEAAGSGQRATSRVHVGIPRHELRQSSDPSRKPVAKSLTVQTESLDRGIPHDPTVISRNKQSEIILLSTFPALTRRRRRIAAYTRYPDGFCPSKFNSQR